MTYTILSAQYANEENTAAVVTTEEAGAVLTSEADTPDLWADMLAWGVPGAYIAPSEPISEQESLSDWRVGLIKGGRFLDVRSKVEAARDSGTEGGLIAWQRFEYANFVYRAELMALKDVFGFSEAEVDQSMMWARQVREAAAV